MLWMRNASPCLTDDRGSAREGLRSSLRWLVLAALLTGAPFVSGCAALRAAAAQQEVVHARTSSHVYRMPCASAWPAVRGWLFEQGFQVRPYADTALIVETEWRIETTGSQGRYVRYLAQAAAPAPDACQLMLFKARQQGTSQYTERDLDAEWIILQRLDPAGAQQIADDANRAGQAAR